jgi:N6-adenosine-specific RNA methylase IME4
MKRDLAKRFPVSDCLDKNDPRGLLAPNGNQCPVRKALDVQKNQFTLWKLVNHGETGFNVLCNRNDPFIDYLMRNCGQMGKTLEFIFQELENLKEEDLKEQLRLVKEKLSHFPDTPKLSGGITFVFPWDQHLTTAKSIRADVRQYDFKALGSKIQFDVILMDPPWKILEPSHTRGVELNYDLLSTEEIEGMGIRDIQTDGYLFMWIVASALPAAVSILTNWGYEITNFIHWVKCSKNGKIQSSNGCYLTHAKETLLVGRKGAKFLALDFKPFNDVFVHPRQPRQSQKPPSIYTMIEAMFKNGIYLEIFARPYNLRDGWVSIGNELLG